MIFISVKTIPVSVSVFLWVRLSDLWQYTKGVWSDGNLCEERRNDCSLFALVGHENLA